MSDQAPATREITIQGETIVVPQPYAEGPIELTAGEASALNQVFAENIRNNVASKIKKGQDESVTDYTLEQAKADAQKYADEYEFSVRAVGATALDPVDREAKKIAREYVDAKIKESGKKVKDVDKEKREEMINELAFNNEKVRKLAKQRVSNVEKLDLDVDVPAGAPETNEDA